MTDRERWGIPKGWDRLEYYAATHKLDLVYLYMLGCRKEFTMKRWRLGPECKVWILPSKTPPPEAARPAPGRKPCKLEQDSYAFNYQGRIITEDVKYDLSKLTKDLGLKNIDDCKGWLWKVLGPGANLISDKKNMGVEKYELFLQIGRAQGLGA